MKNLINNEGMWHNKPQRYYFTHQVGPQYFKVKLAFLYSQKIERVKKQSSQQGNGRRLIDKT